MSLKLNSSVSGASLLKEYIEWNTSFSFVGKRPESYEVLGKLWTYVSYIFSITSVSLVFLSEILSSTTKQDKLIAHPHNI